ncbi:hypothetical protein ACFVTJ_01440 [Agrobacterium sp. NPDC058088]|uniref:hypothetical protein n=1 Tax=Agrobacterium sp. NPDC058088 TaxID=3346335 RepID=UPI0036D8E8D3
MAISFKGLGRSASGSSRSPLTKAQQSGLPSIRNTFSAGQSSVRASSASAKSAQVSRSSQSASSPQSSFIPQTSSTDDMTSSVFMQTLKAKLSTSGDDPAQYLRSRSMMDALGGGRMKVSEPTKGKAVNAWDPSQKSAKPAAATDIAKTDWVDFLNSHLKRSDDGTFSKSNNGNYVDKTTGANAYFGKVADRYYYVTWPSETKT